MKNYKKFYHVNRYWFHIRNLLWFPIYLVAKIIPKKDICIFGSMSGYAIADNSKYLFMHTYKENYYWITKNKNLLSQEILHDVFPVYAYSLKGIFLQMRAKNAYYTHKIDDFVAPLIMGAKITALWHGVPFKKIGAAENHEIEISNFKKTIRRLRTYLLPYSYYMYCDFVICPDKRFEDNYRQCFSFSKPEIIIQQLPRNVYAKINSKERKILYAPTYRRYRSITDVLLETQILSSEFINFLRKFDITFVIRPHPIDAQSVAELLTKSPQIKIDLSEDIYETLTTYSLFITDYSSLWYDSEFLGLPCLFLSDDIDEYLAENGLFSDFVSLLRQKSRKTILEFLSDIELLFKNGEEKIW